MVPSVATLGDEMARKAPTCGGMPMTATMGGNPVMGGTPMLQMMMGQQMGMPQKDASAMPFQPMGAVADGDAGLDAKIIRPATFKERIRTQERVATGSVIDALSWPATAAAEKPSEAFRRAAVSPSWARRAAARPERLWARWLGWRQLTRRLASSSPCRYRTGHR